jgi:hypothetical protein
MTPQMNEVIFLVGQAPEGAYVARALGLSIFVEADTLDAIRAQCRDAVRCHFDEGQAPNLIRLHFARDARPGGACTFRAPRQSTRPRCDTVVPP